MEFIDYYKTIQNNRQSIIDYYANQFGEEMRQMFEERFDRIKFCFYINPNDIDSYIQLESYYQGLHETVNFINEVVKLDDEKSVRQQGGSIVGNPRILAALKCFFGGTMSLYFNMGSTDTINYEGLWTFLPDLAITNASVLLENRNNLARKIGKKIYTFDEFQIEQKCKFFKEMGLFDEEMDNETIAKSERFDELCEKYSKLARRALEYRNRVKEKFIELSNYSKALIDVESYLGDDKVAIAKRTYNKWKFCS